MKHTAIPTEHHGFLKLGRGVPENSTAPLTSNPPPNAPGNTAGSPGLAAAEPTGLKETPTDQPSKVEESAMASPTKVSSPAPEAIVSPAAEGGKAKATPTIIAPLAGATPGSSKVILANSSAPATALAPSEKPIANGEAAKVVTRVTVISPAIPSSIPLGRSDNPAINNSTLAEQSSDKPNQQNTSGGNVIAIVCVIALLGGVSMFLVPRIRRYLKGRYNRRSREKSPESDISSQYEVYLNKSEVSLKSAGSEPERMRQFSNTNYMTELPNGIAHHHATIVHQQAIHFPAFAQTSEPYNTLPCYPPSPRASGYTARYPEMILHPVDSEGNIITHEYNPYLNIPAIKVDLPPNENTPLSPAKNPSFGKKLQGGQTQRQSILPPILFQNNKSHNHFTLQGENDFPSVESIIYKVPSRSPTDDIFQFSIPRPKEKSGEKSEVGLIPLGSRTSSVYPHEAFKP
ncbi:hypothetical protein BY996DRAFT_6424027 [Phakopsora pachyrhizi]|uniref:Expressed protein n=1 Tax=Phakopsora pachyrhizi TaxID=170000 RepID=A0AAV0APH0_PHAPC|nr:hypothetical protein BY996DRAFT_6424027 [Phakopsora pachyrhizi]CAH7670356.1 expressed protein [Phakopsora pachyrhizi]